MSGGYWEYQGYPILQGLNMVAEDPVAKARWPKTTAAFGGLGPLLYQLEHDMDWDLSGDSFIPDDGKFDAEAIEQLLRVIFAASRIGTTKGSPK